MPTGCGGRRRARYAVQLPDRIMDGTAPHRQGARALRARGLELAVLDDGDEAGAVREDVDVVARGDGLGGVIIS